MSKIVQFYSFVKFRLHFAGQSFCVYITNKLISVQALRPFIYFCHLKVLVLKYLIFIIQRLSNHCLTHYCNVQKVEGDAQNLRLINGHFLIISWGVIYGLVYQFFAY